MSRRGILITVLKKMNLLRKGKKEKMKKILMKKKKETAKMKKKSMTKEKKKEQVYLPLSIYKFLDNILQTSLSTLKILVLDITMLSMIVQKNI